MTEYHALRESDKINSSRRAPFYAPTVGAFSSATYPADVARLLRSFATFFALGAFANFFIAWLCVLPSTPGVDRWVCYHNPYGHADERDPIVMILVASTGREIASGMGRPGTFLDQHPDEVYIYYDDVWWPRESVTNDDAEFAVAAGWPMRCLMAWRTVSTVDLPEEIEFRHHDHWGIALDVISTRSGSLFGKILPLLPMPIGFVVNTVSYTFVFALAWNGTRRLNRWRRQSRNECAACAYPIGPAIRCPECGTTHVVASASSRVAFLPVNPSQRCTITSQ